MNESRQNIRRCAVAGTFYPGDKARLIEQLDTYLAAGIAKEPSEAVAEILPHAGYIYSGGVAGDVIGRVRVPDRVIVLGTKHRPQGALVAASEANFWRFPFGEVPVDLDLLGKIVDTGLVEWDELAHQEEHSLEVQVPFLWRRNPSVRIAPIVVGVHDLERIEQLGKALASVIGDLADPVLILASTDMSHYVPQEQAEKLDRLAIENILSLDPAGLFKTVAQNNISMCGVVPTTVALFAARELGACDAELIRYATSGEVSGDKTAVVGYAGLKVF